jgi:hypothetical protein
MSAVDILKEVTKGHEIEAIKIRCRTSIKDKATRIYEFKETSLVLPKGYTPEDYLEFERKLDKFRDTDVSEDAVIWLKDETWIDREVDEDRGYSWWKHRVSPDLPHECCHEDDDRTWNVCPLAFELEDCHDECNCCEECRDTCADDV